MQEVWEQGAVPAIQLGLNHGRDAVLGANRNLIINNMFVHHLLSLQKDSSYQKLNAYYQTSTVFTLSAMKTVTAPSSHGYSTLLNRISWERIR